MCAQSMGFLVGFLESSPQLGDLGTLVSEAARAQATGEGMEGRFIFRVCAAWQGCREYPKHQK